MKDDIADMQLKPRDGERAAVVLSAERSIRLKADASATPSGTHLGSKPIEPSVAANGHRGMEKDRLLGIRVLLVDDSPVVIDGLRSILRSASDIEIVGDATGGEEAVKKSTELAPDVVVVDAQMPDMDGVEATRRIKEAVPTAKVLFMAIHSDRVEAAIEAGADYCLGKDCTRHEFISAVRALGNGSPNSASR